ncbi:carboxypeptidase-like regulatory domain-containing protein [Bremerella sp. JC770]|uniref:carboxypeptidase-like regulatory domain-containing protein n=1 Tax=Bremerella sp. JC770 TaxID=3232137 RepID=UPI003458D6FF
MQKLASAMLFLLFALSLYPGCSGRDKNLPNLGEVSGTVTLDNQPMPNVSVAFESQSGQVSFGKTDDQGHYELTYRDGVMGAEVGQNKVRIETVMDAPPGPGYRDPIPAKYNRDTTLTVDVGEGENTHDFSLTSK